MYLAFASAVPDVYLSICFLSLDLRWFPATSALMAIRCGIADGMRDIADRVMVDNEDDGITSG